ncbi:MAG: electron transfer flavoprotein-ubiquinone oxidoreductase [Alphaproteobacteria bacterium]|jgi:electron-transferring-flavoprotein dehydrogenase|tara:strand:+ start:12345 stop:14006 length:1662 start_codon:yes stop_codon:yes gene_type:complete
MTEIENRESIDIDVVIVGAGPAGLATAIKLKQQADEAGKEISITVLEKGSEVGAHILSGAVIDPVGLDSLLPNWRDLDHPVMDEVVTDKFYLLGPAGGIRIPNLLMPPIMSNDGCYVTSLSNLTKWLGNIAESMGIEIYPGFPANEILYSSEGSVIGVATGDLGVAKDQSKKETYMRGMEIFAKYTVFAEGVRGQLSKKIIDKFKLDRESDTQKYGLGLKELWEIPKDNHTPGLVQHTMGWPLDKRTGGGSFLYHFDKNLVSIGFVVHLNYTNPHLSPYEEFQRFKTHPMIKEILKGGKRISYGARAINEGGYQSVPKLTFPGGVLVGCSAGFVNVPRIKGSHNAILTGVMAAESIFDAIIDNRSNDEAIDYQNKYDFSDVKKELNKVKNVKPLWSRFGTYLGISLGGIDMWLRNFGINLPITMSHRKADHETLEIANDRNRIVYPKPDGEYSFDKPSSVFLSATNHEEDQPVHLQVNDMDMQINSEFQKYGGPSGNYCPAGVYEWIGEQDNKRLQINSQNCVHCKTCDIKDPNQNITWVAPEGGGGPNYSNM